MATSDPFTTLGIAPTTDLAAVKRGYFTALRAHPPHADPDGFARVRAAYEALQSPTERARLTLTAPLDLAAALRALDDRFRPAAPAAADERSIPDAVAAASLHAMMQAPLGDVITKFRAARE